MNRFKKILENIKTTFKESIKRETEEPSLYSKIKKKIKEKKL